VYSGKSLPTLQKNVSVPSSGSKMNNNSCLFIAVCFLGLILDSGEGRNMGNC
jgi:hypothetical protein